jgi:hypothetical protein
LYDTRRSPGQPDELTKPVDRDEAQSAAEELLQDEGEGGDGLGGASPPASCISTMEPGAAAVVTAATIQLVASQGPGASSMTAWLRDLSFYRGEVAPRRVVLCG